MKMKDKTQCKIYIDCKTSKKLNFTKAPEHCIKTIVFVKTQK